MAATQTHDTYCYSVKVHRGFNLPRADRLGTIDGYIKLIFPGASSYERTCAKENDYNPNWKQRIATTGVLGDIRGELWDYNCVQKDTLMGTFTIPQADLPCVKKKYTINVLQSRGKQHEDRPSEILISAGRLVSYQTLKIRMQSWPGVIFQDAQEKVFVPVPNTHCLLCVDYERDDHGRKIDLRLLETTNDFHTNHKFARFAFVPVPFKHVIKRNTPNSELMQVGPHKIYAESKLQNFQFWSPITTLHVETADYTLVFDKDLGTITVAHGWAGSLGYEAAKTTLHDITFDDAHKFIFLKNEYGCYKIDYDAYNSDQAWHLTLEKYASDMVADLTHESTNKRTYKFYSHPVEVGGTKIMQRAAVDDLEYPVIQSKLHVRVMQLSNRKGVPLLTLAPLW